MNNSADNGRIQSTRVESYLITCMVRNLRSFLPTVLKRAKRMVVFLPYSRHVAVIMHDIKVADSAVTLRNTTNIHARNHQFKTS